MVVATTSISMTIPSPSTSAMSATTVQITMTTAGSSDLSKSRYVTVTLPRESAGGRDGDCSGSPRSQC
jgi:hypothetical protein